MSIDSLFSSKCTQECASGTRFFKRSARPPEPWADLWSESWPRHSRARFRVQKNVSVCLASSRKLHENSSRLCARESGKFAASIQGNENCSFRFNSERRSLMSRATFARWRSCFLWVAVLALALASPAAAQTDVTTGRMTGTVRDADGGALHGATVEAKNDDTGYSARATTRADGFYQIVNLPVGTYTLSASLAGFKTATRPAVRLDVGFAPTVDF